jgi:hypothetical protein
MGADRSGLTVRRLACDKNKRVLGGRVCTEGAAAAAVRSGLCAARPGVRIGTPAREPAGARARRAAVAVSTKRPHSPAGCLYCELPSGCGVLLQLLPTPVPLTCR